jgi:hypothetical protein
LLVFSTLGGHYTVNLPECGADEGQMDELIERLVAKLGAEQAVEKKTVGIAVQIPAELDPARTIDVDNEVSIAPAPISTAKSDAKSGSRCSAGPVRTDSREICDRMTVAGTRTRHLRLVDRQLEGFAREKIGDDAFGESSSSIPVLGQLA